MLGKVSTIVCCLVAPALAQSGNQTSAMTHDVVALERIELVSTPAINLARIQTEDLEREAQGMAPRRRALRAQPVVCQDNRQSL